MGKHGYGLCTVCNEQKRIAAKGLCWKHYMRAKRHDGDVSDPDFTNKGKQCKVHDCSDDAATGGYCHKHYIRHQKYGDTSVKGKPSDSFKPMEYNPDKCVLHGCNDTVSSKELCYKHYHNYQYHKRQGLVNTVYDFLRLREANPL